MANPIRNLGANGMPALCGHIKNLKSIVYQIGYAFQETMSEIEEAINDYPVASSIVVSTEGWHEVTPENSQGEYKYYYDIVAPSIDSSDLPIVSVAPGSLSSASNSGLCPTCESLNGKIRLYAVSIPKIDLSVSCWIIKGQTASEKSAAIGEIENWDAMATITGGNS